MKNLFFLLIGILTSTVALSQEPIAYTEVIKVDTALTKDALYNSARAWFAETFNSAQDVIQMEDKSEGIIIGKGNTEYNSNIFLGSAVTQGWIRYTINVQVKEGRYKYELSDFIHEGSPYNGSGPCSFGLITTDEEVTEKACPSTGIKWNNKVWKDIKAHIDEVSMGIITDLKASMAENALAEDDW